MAFENKFYFRGTKCASDQPHTQLPDKPLLHPTLCNGVLFFSSEELKMTHERFRYWKAHHHLCLCRNRPSICRLIFAEWMPPANERLHHLDNNWKYVLWKFFTQKHFFILLCALYCWIISSFLIFFVFFGNFFLLFRWQENILYFLFFT